MNLIEKYTPDSVDNIYFHKKVYARIVKMCEDTAFPHIIIHGGSGSGKKTMVKIILKMLYGDDANRLYNVVHDVKGSSNKSNDEIIKHSEHHIIIKPKNTNYDKYLVNNVIMDYMKKTAINSYNAKNKFKAVQIDNLDKLSYYAQTSLRCTIENFSKNCRFIMWCESLSRIIPALKSRCICVRLEKPSDIKLFKYIFHVISIEKIKISFDILCKIIITSNNNIKMALWKIEMYRYNNSIDTNYDKSMNNIIRNLINDKCIYKKYYSARNMLYNLIITNIGTNIILEDLIKKLLDLSYLDDVTKIKIVLHISEFEHNIVRGRRAIYHFDAILIILMKIFNDIA